MAKPFIIDDSTPERDLFHPEFGEHGGRGLDLTLKGSEGYAGVADPFPESMVIPRSEWQARIQERQERKATLREKIEAAGMVVKDQQRTNYCTPEDTEVLTDRGWVQWPNYNGSDLLGTVNPASGRLEFQAPLATQVFEHNGPLVYSTNKAVDFAVTPDHRMLVREWNEKARRLANHWTFKKARDLGWYFGLPPAATGFIGTRFQKLAIEGDREYEGLDFIALVSLVVSDGYAGGTEKTRDWVSFACFREDRLPLVRELAARIGFTEKASSPGVFVRYSAGALAEWFRANAYTSPELGAENKRIPDFIKAASESQIRHFLEFYGDQNHDRGNHYFSASKRAIDDLQELFLRVGKRASIWSEERGGKTGVLADGGKIITSRKRMHHLHVRQVDRLSIDRKEHIETDWYKGLVYCATVPNSTLVTRRNGSMLISGNCWINAPTFSTEVVRMLQGQKYVPLSPASAGAQIKNFRNVGGWGKEGLQWITSNGLVPVAQWPANAIDRQYATDANKALALNYRVDEWWELEPNNLDHLVSALLLDVPSPIGLSWWGHEVTAVDPLWVDGAIAIQFANSWGAAWGDNGYGVLQGRKMIPDDCIAPRTALAY